MSTSPEPSTVAVRTAGDDRLVDDLGRADEVGRGDEVG
jgi:hypothetical protein